MSARKCCGGCALSNKVRLMWIPAHVGVPENDMVDGMHCQKMSSTTSVKICGATFTHRLNLAFYLNGNADGTEERGRYAFSNWFPPLHHWFHGLEADRPFSTVMSNHTRVKSHKTGQR
jgi:hypothetical protein